jgi:hypothetical protein
MWTGIERPLYVAPEPTAMAEVAAITLTNKPAVTILIRLAIEYA